VVPTTYLPKDYINLLFFLPSKRNFQFLFRLEHICFGLKCLPTPKVRPKWRPLKLKTKQLFPTPKLRDLHSLDSDQKLWNIKTLFQQVRIIRYIWISLIVSYRLQFTCLLKFRIMHFTHNLKETRLDFSLQ
jgi:hypothetical protein